MAKKEKDVNEVVNEDKLNSLSNINPFEYTYKPDAGVTISAALFMAVLDFAGAIAQKEAQQLIPKAEFINGKLAEQPEGQRVVVYTTPIGNRAEDIFNEAMELHMSNIDKGYAFQAQKSKFDFEDANEGQ